MSIYRPNPVSSEPRAILTNWTVYETPEGDHHFVGYNLVTMDGRVSSKVVEFDKTTMLGKTRSGRVYELRGIPQPNGDAEYVWNIWKRANNVTEFRDVSNEYRDITGDS